MPVKPEVKELLICYEKPQKSVMSDTVSRWTCAGVAISVYKAHSDRSQSLNKARDIEIFFQDILRISCWKIECIKNLCHKGIINGNNFLKSYKKFIYFI